MIIPTLLLSLASFTFSGGSANAGGSANPAGTGGFHGVNWADPHDNYSDSVVVPSGLSTSDDYAAVQRKSGAVLAAFKERGANTVRLPVNPYTVAADWWKAYAGAIDEAKAEGMRVILAYWEGTAHKDGLMDDTTQFWRMWQRITTQYAADTNVYFEVFNEPFGYTVADLKDLYARWLRRYSAVPAGRVFLDGAGYATNVNDIGADSRFNGCLLSYHQYTWFDKKRKTEADWRGAVDDLAYPGRTVMTEFGIPMTSRRNYADSSGDPSVAYLRGITGRLRAAGIGSVYWPGLRNGDVFSLVSFHGDTLRTNNPSGLARVQYGWGMTHRFTLGDSTFLLDGKPFLMISGEMHYARVPREAWRQRMRMAKAMGLNTIGTYVFWNLHEPEKGRFDFTGNNDIAAFVRTAQEEGLWVILRPSPYVCAEWEYGGYPYWLQNEKGLVVRSTEPTYLKDYKEYIDAVGRELAPLQVNHGGNILMIQVENEYGSYASDSNYLAVNRRLFRDAGFDGLLYTCDPVSDVSRGHLDGLLPAVNGLVDPAHIRAVVNRYHGGKGPYCVAEWYPAWFDWWGEPHHTVPAAGYAAQLENLLAGGVSINMYMFHGGTTRGFMNGANLYDTSGFQPEISSYDYDAPLDEAGNPTEKYMVFRKVIQAHTTGRLPDVPPARPAIALSPVSLDRVSSVFEALPAPVVSARPLTFEDLHQAYGYVLYRTTINGRGRRLLRIDGLRDYAVVFVDGVRKGMLDRRARQDSLWLDLFGPARLDILVENLGRINFGKYLLQNRKGITGSVTLGGRVLGNWNMYRLPFDTTPNVGAIAAVPAKTAPVATAPAKPTPGVPVLKAGSFQLDTVADTYLDMSAWGKGVAWINGHNLGRYWRIGPQQTLYVPAEWLRRGQNDVVIFDLLGATPATLQGLDHPILNRLMPPLP